MHESRHQEKNSEKSRCGLECRKATLSRSGCMQMDMPQPNSEPSKGGDAQADQANDREYDGDRLLGRPRTPSHKRPPVVRPNTRLYTESGCRCFL